MNIIIATTQIQVRALDEVADLMSNGYNVVLKYQDKNLWFIKLKHSTNGRTLVVKWKPDFYVITEEKLILKFEGEML